MQKHAKIAIPLGARFANKCGREFPVETESETEKRRVIKRKQVCVNPGKISSDPVRYKIRKNASVPVKGNVQNGNHSKYAGKDIPAVADKHRLTPMSMLKHGGGL